MSSGSILNTRPAFERGLYKWANQLSQTEVEAGFPLLGLYRQHGARAFFEATEDFSKPSKLELLVALMKRRHSCCDDPITDHETKLLDLYDAKGRSHMFERCGMPQEPSLKGKELRRSITDRLRGNYLLTKNPRMPSGISMEIQAGDFMIRTTFDVGGRVCVLSYWHDVTSLDGKNVAELVSCLSWFGLNGMTGWDCISEENFVQVWHTIEVSMGVFLKNAPLFLK